MLETSSAEIGEFVGAELEFVGLERIKDGFGSMRARNHEHVVALGELPRW